MPVNINSSDESSDSENINDMIKRLPTTLTERGCRDEQDKSDAVSQGYLSKAGKDFYAAGAST